MDETCEHRKSRARNATYGHCHEPGCPNEADLATSRGGTPLRNGYEPFDPDEAERHLTVSDARDTAYTELLLGRATARVRQLEETLKSRSPSREEVYRTLVITDARRPRDVEASTDAILELLP